jgi:dihydroflavonol-4-reductase
MVEPSSKPKKPLVVITGVSGYLGSQILATFVIGDGRGNYRVRATVRDKNNEAKMKPLRDALEEAYSEVEFFNADLLNEDGWSTAIEGADYVVHTASPVQMNNPTDHDILIKPAVNGVDYVMKAAIRHGVKRVVMTSSVAAVMSVPERDAPEVFDESCWSEE